MLSCVRLFATPWTATRQASLSVTNSWSLLKLMSIESVMPSNHLILCHPPLLLPSLFPSIRVFSNESVLHIRWANYWSFSLLLAWFVLNIHQGLCAQSCPTLSDPMDCSHQTPLSMGFSRQEYWSGLSFPSPGDLPNPGI